MVYHLRMHRRRLRVHAIAMRPLWHVALRTDQDWWIAVPDRMRLQPDENTKKDRCVASPSWVAIVRLAKAPLALNESSVFSPNTKSGACVYCVPL